MKRSYKKESMRWMTQAEDEFADADDLRLRNRFYLALFHFQQAAEKALKGYLYYTVKSVEVFHTHSVAELLKMCCELDPSFQQLSGAKKLDRYYIPTRYPNSLPGGIPSRFYDDPVEAAEAMELSRAVIALAGAKLKAAKDDRTRRPGR